LLPWFGLVTKIVERRNTQNKIGQQQQQITKFHSYKNCTTLFNEIACWSKRYSFRELKKRPASFITQTHKEPIFSSPHLFLTAYNLSSLQSCKIREHP
jgi:hypothetical protein